jgi:acyl-CoA synthetase (NDP forming)
MVVDLDRLLKPRTLAVIGGKEAQRVIEQCDKLGFSGTIWPVHPEREEMQGRRCYRNLESLPASPDAAYVAVNRDRTIAIVADLLKAGAGGAVCYAAGFAEADRENSGSGDLQKRLVEAAGSMPIIGPNCYGFVNALDGVALWPDQHGAVRCERGVAILTQSSNIAINLSMQKRGLPIAALMTVGNQAQQGLSKLALGWLEDDRVTAIGLHIEGLDDVRAFESLALRARQLRKPIVVLKVGKSHQAKVAALTHTASMAGSDAAHTALFHRLGVAQVDGLEPFLETLKLLHVGGPLSGRDLVSLSCSGGEASLMADAAEDYDVTFRAFSQGKAQKLKQELGPIVTIANPLDYNTFIWGDWLALEQMYELALESDFDLALLVNDYPRLDRCDDADWQRALDSFIAAVVKTGARAANVASLPETMPEPVASRLIAAGIAPLCGLDNAIIAAQVAAGIGAAWAGDPPMALLGSTGEVSNFVVLDEHESKLELAAAGLIVPKSVVVDDQTDLQQALAGLEFPLVVKALGVAHKSDVGAVILGLESLQQVLLAVQNLAIHGRRLLIEEMAARPVAEIMVGIARDPVCGLMMTIGSGGVLAELLDDTTHLLLPASETDIRRALFSLKMSPLLDGYRGGCAADMDALLANIICIGDYAVRHVDTLEELDVNPLFAARSGSVAVDALIVKKENP